jgi:hypothetical protein
MDNHRFNSTHPKEAAKVAFGIISGLQGLQENLQVVGGAMVFTLLCRRFGLDPRDTLDRCDRMLGDALRDNNEHTSAIRTYLLKELT